MKNWQKLLQASLTHPEEIPARLRPATWDLKAVTARYPMRINPYYLGLIRHPGDPLWLQSIPDPIELDDRICPEDPLEEENLSPVPNLVHKYPDRALFLINSTCAMNCRFCTRKRKVGTPGFRIDSATLGQGIDYLERTPAIRDVLISGGDPLLLDDDRLEWILARVRRIPTVSIIRLGSRVPCTLPMRVTTGLARMLKKFHPLYLNTHFNHPDEITPEAAKACGRLADAGIPLGCQTVLLKGVNDQEVIIKQLMQKLLHIRVKPYYIFQGDMTRGTNHFRTPIETGMKIMRALIGHTSGMGVPRFAIDLPGGFGKVPMTPDYLVRTGGEMIFQNYQGRYCSYLDPEVAPE
ncbi:MAG: KamA family radical SAM protein [Proteobacteria bacterium]|nr:KamA family radical SAM protein [Pseudomonadota bacterium]MBU1687994.1 KamA family radical SAM protein [Pseudomonadota bacterium]